MKSLTDLLGMIFTVILYIAITWGEVVGIVHAFRQHSAGDGFSAVFIPPVAWYRGLEFFWHKYPEPPTADERKAGEYLKAYKQVEDDKEEVGHKLEVEADDLKKKFEGQRSVKARIEFGDFLSTMVERLSPFQTRLTQLDPPPTLREYHLTSIQCLNVEIESTRLMATGFHDEDQRKILKAKDDYEAAERDCPNRLEVALQKAGYHGEADIKAAIDKNK
jgi:hypothetical protein